MASQAQDRVPPGSIVIGGPEDRHRRKRVGALVACSVIAAAAASALAFAARLPWAALVAAAAAVAGVIAAWRTMSPVRRSFKEARRVAESHARRGYAVSFGYKCAWLSIRSDTPDAVMAALPVKRPRPADWAEGIEAAYAGRAFVSPAVDGWVLVVSASLPEAPAAGEETDRLTPLLVRLSATLGTEVQSFATHRVVEYHHWFRAQGGRIARAFVWLGERGATVADTGDPALDGDVDRPPTEETVMQVAGRWSIDPRTLDEREDPVGPGWVAELSL